VLELLFGTTNPGKLRELRRLVSELDVRVVSPENLERSLPEVVEDGCTFHENAAKKASAYARFSGLHALADDSGLCVDALGGLPGVHSARWSDLDGPVGPVCAMPQGAARELGTELSRSSRDEANNDKLLVALAGVPEAQRGARYVAVLALARPDGTIAAQVEGICTGRIGHVRRGSRGFGYDPLFFPDEEAAKKLPVPPLAPGQPPPAAPTLVERTMAELESAEKDAISHRGAAFRALRPMLEKLAFDKTEQ
jgi:XTP/dITP diphosphohydrolase